MPSTVDYLPFATGSGANVDSQVDFDGSGYQQFGFQSGLAQSKQLNKVWRQSSMIAAAIANLISQRLGINVLDDGNLTNLITELGEAFGQSQVLDSNVVPVNGGASSTSFFSLMTYSIPASVWYVGKQIRLTAAGTIQLETAENATISLSQNGATSDPNLIVSSTGLANSDWFAEILISCLTTGSSGELLVTGEISVDHPGSGAVTPGNSNFLQDLFVNLTNPFVVGIGGVFSVSNASNLMTQSVLLVEALN